MYIKQLVRKYTEQNWALGFVRGGMTSVMESNHLDVEWVKMPKDRWYADPFVLDVTEKEILLLVEDFCYDIHKGVISLLHINRSTKEIVSRKMLLELPTHLSFPAIWRNDGRIYVYPESALSGRLDMYEFHPQTETLTFVKTICDDVVWDSYITEAFGEPLMFTAAHNDNILDIYKWDDKKERFVPYTQVRSNKPNSRMGGAAFEYKGQCYYPAQNCEKTYGGAIDIKRIEFKNERVRVLETVKHIESPNRRYPMGIHTLNEYKDIVVIDVKGYRYGWFGELVSKIGGMKKLIKKWTI